MSLSCASGPYAYSFIVNILWASSGYIYSNVVRWACVAHKIKSISFIFVFFTFTDWWFNKFTSYSSFMTIIASSVEYSPVDARSPAEHTFIFVIPLSSSIFFINPSAIALLHVFPVHINIIFFICSMCWFLQYFSNDSI